MDLQTSKVRFMEVFLRIQDEGIIEKLMNVLKKENQKTYKKKLKPMTLDELQKRLDRSEEDIKEGRVYTTEEVRNHFKNKLK